MRAEEESVDTLHRYIGRLSIGRVTIDSHPIINQLKILLFFLVRCINTFVIVLGATQILQNTSFSSILWKNITLMYFNKGS